MPPKVELSFFFEEGSEQVKIRIPDVDEERWGFFDLSAEEEVLSLMARLVSSYLNNPSSSVMKDRKLLEDSMNILLERAVDKGALRKKSAG